MNFGYYAYTYIFVVLGTYILVWMSQTYNYVLVSVINSVRKMKQIDTGNTWVCVHWFYIYAYIHMNIFMYMYTIYAYLCCLRSCPW